MMQKTSQFLGFVTVFMLAMAPVAASADEILPIVPHAIDPSTIIFPDQAIPVPAPLPEPKPPAFLDAVARAKAMLTEKMNAQNAKRKEVRVISTRDTYMDITIAVWNRDADQIQLFEAKKNGVKLQMVDAAPYKIKVTSHNGANSYYEISAPNHLVVGVIYPILKEITVKKKKLYELHDVVYVPNNAAFYRPEILAAGSDYLSFLIQDAFDELRAKGIRSAAFPDKLLVDVVDPYLVKSIAVIEHSDSRIFGKNEPERAVGAFLVSLALNKDDAYNLSVSSAGARGLVQFIPSTYNLLVKRLPKLELISDFKTGMSDHRNAIKAQVALLDNELRAMPASVRTAYATNSQTASPYLAAAYNGGGARVRKALEFWGEDAWFKPHGADKDALIDVIERLKSNVKLLKRKLAKTEDAKEIKAIKKQITKDENDIASGRARLAAMKSGSLFLETTDYLTKLGRVYTMFSAGFFATPNAPTGALPELPKIVASS